MTTSFTKRRATLGLPRELASIKPVAMGCAVLMLAASAQAQDAPPVNTLDTVVVTGIRKGIEDAISVKKNSDGVVEAISAEDIGKLPDTTIADSLARLPGVTTQRTSKGEASTISIRGLGPDFNAYLLNGREQASTGDSRAVDLSVYPAELIGGATVYKTSDATLTAAGLAGTLDTRLIDPLAFSKRTAAVSYQKVRNSLGTPVPGTGTRKSLTYIDQFADRTIGVAVGYVKADGTSGSIGNDGWGGGGATNVGLAGGGTLASANFAPAIGGGFGYKTDRNADDRSGLAAILSYKPNKNFNTELDYYHAKIKMTDRRAQMQLGTGGVQVINATVDANNNITKGTFVLPAEDANGPHGLIARTEDIFDDDKIESLGWRTNIQMAPAWKLTSDFSHNSARRVERDIEAYGGILGADTLTFDTTQGSIPQFTSGNAASYTSPSLITIRDQTGWSGTTAPQDGYDKGPTIVDKVDAVRFDITRDLDDGGIFSSVQFGGMATRRTKDRTGVEGLIVPATSNQYNTIPYPTGAYTINNVGGTGFNFLTFDPTASLWAGAALQPKYNDDILSKTWSVHELVTTGYIKGNIDTQWGGIPVRGNVGVQLVQTDQSSSGFRANVGSGVTLTNPAIAPSTDGVSYVDILPSLNLTGDFGTGKLLRLGVSKQIARNNMTDMRNSLALSLDTTKNSTGGLLVGSAGNPQLKPFKATAFDLSFEKYFATKAYMSAAVFFKKLDTYIAPQTNLAYDFTSLAQALHVGPAPVHGYVGQFTQTVNGSGGNLKGIELAGSLPFDLMTKYLSGFGASASYSYTNSSIQLPNLIGLNPTQQVPISGTIGLPGLSKTNAKAILYFEKWGFSAFVADNYRSTFVGSVANSTIGGYPTLQTIKGSSWVSAQVGYEIQSGYAKGLAVRFEGNNLNDPTYTQLNADGSINSTNKTGHQYILMFSYKYQ